MKEIDIKIEYKESKDIFEKEINLKIDKAFDLLFDEVLKNN